MKTHIIKNRTKTKALIVLSSVCIHSLTATGALVDVFMATGQSNAGYDSFAWGSNIRSEITSSGLYSNPYVITTAHPGEPLNEWMNNGTAGALYQQDFFNSSGTGWLQIAMNNFIAAGDTPVFRGLYWFQGESDGLSYLGGSVPLYTSRWNDLLNQLGSDLGTTDWNYLMNTVGNSGQDINDVLKDITDADSRGVLFNTQTPLYKTDPDDIHGYNHALVGQDNVALFNATFVPEPSSPLLILTSVFFLAGQRKRV